MTKVELPRSSADIDAAWLESALREGGIARDVSVVSVTYEPATTAVNLMGEILRAHVSWSPPDPELPASLIVKLPSPSEDNHALSLAMGYYEAEHRFYEKLAADAGLRTPRCWFTGGEAERGHYALVLDDLGVLDSADQLEGLDLDRAAKTLRALGAMHGRWWNDPELAAMPWLPQGYGEGVRVYGLLMNDAWPAWSSSAGELLDRESLDLAERFVNSWDELIDATLDDPWTLLHRDFRVDNMMFDPEGPIVFDWGGVARGTALYDFAYFIAGSLDTALRREHQDDLVRVYRDALTRAGVSPASDDEFLRWFHFGALCCLIVPILAGGDVIDRKDEKGRTLISTVLKRTFDLLHDIDAGEALPR